MAFVESAQEDATLVDKKIGNVDQLGAMNSIVGLQRNTATNLLVGAVQSAEVFAAGEIMPNNIGRISEIAIALSAHSGIDVSSQLRTLYAFLQRKRDDKMFSVTVIYDADYLKTKFLNGLRSAGIDSQISTQFVKSDNQNQHSIWIRDGAIRKGIGTILLPCNRQGAACEYLAQSEGSSIIKSNLFFDGGDIRTTISHAFVGIQTVYKNIFNPVQKGTKPITCEDIDEVVHRLEKEFGKKIIVVGLEKNPEGTYKPFEAKDVVLHTDMIVTPLNDTDVLVAQWNGNAALEKIRRYLQAQGFNVIELPYDEFRIGLDSPGQLTYNNVLLEEYGGTKYVYLPQYCVKGSEEASWGVSPQLLKRYNDQARGDYEKCGYSCIPIEVSLSIAKRRGSLNCLTFEKRANE